MTQISTGNHQTQVVDGHLAPPSAVSGQKTDCMSSATVRSDTQVLRANTANEPVTLFLLLSELSHGADKKQPPHVAYFEHSALQCNLVVTYRNIASKTRREEGAWPENPRLGGIVLSCRVVPGCQSDGAQNGIPEDCSEDILGYDMQETLYADVPLTMVVPKPKANSIMQVSILFTYALSATHYFSGEMPSRLLSHLLRPPSSAHIHANLDSPPWPPP